MTITEARLNLSEVRNDPATCKFCSLPADEIGISGERCLKHVNRGRLAQEFGSFTMTRSELSRNPPTRYVIDGVKVAGAVVSIGNTGTYKSFTELGMALCVATGKQWLGHSVAQGRVLFIIGEGASGLDQRVRAWEEACNGGIPVRDEVFHVARKPGSLSQQATWDALTAYAEEGLFSYIVLDTFSSLAPEADETKDAALTLSRMTDLSVAINGCVTLVHHTGWGDKTRARGGSQFESNADSILIYAAVAEGSPVISVTLKKLKDDQSGAVFYLNALRWTQNGVDSVIMQNSSPSAAGVPTAAKILTSLDGYGPTGATGPQLAEDVESKGSTFYKALNKLITSGKVVKAGNASTRRYYLPECHPGGR